MVGGLVVLLAACAARGPRMQEVGENSYMVTIDAAEVPDGKKVARREAMQVAEAHCVALGQHALPTHLTSGISDFMQGGEVELNFRCQKEEYTGP
ncbi:hypothetical protein B1810_04525 [Panacagrimonas perspica]|nr:hypothetical protein B1810_04525 [Panacagrimonas perspica]